MAREWCPAVRMLANTLKSSIPFLAGTYKDWDGKTYGRLQAAGNPRHQLGVCLDIILYCEAGLAADKTVDWKMEKLLGENLVKVFVDLKDQMKWTEIIYEDRFFWEPEGYRHYGQDRKHFTHIHIDWMTNSLKDKGKGEDEILANSPLTSTNTFAAALSARLGPVNDQWDSNQLTGVNLAGIFKLYSPDKNPVGDWKVSCAQWTWIYSFDASGAVTWMDPFNGLSGKGTWKVGTGAIVFTWESGTPEKWDLPIQPTAQTGSTTMEGVQYNETATRL